MGYVFDTSCAQGLGLLINLVEYSSRNRHFLVEIEVDISYLKDAEAEVKTENDVKTEGEKEKTKECEEGEGEKETSTKTTNGLVALVKVGASLQPIRFLHTFAFGL